MASGPEAEDGDARMRRPLYSSTTRKIPAPPAAPQVAGSRRVWRDRYRRFEKPILFAAGVLLAGAFALGHALTAAPAPQALTLKQVEETVIKTLQKPQPTPASRAWRAVRGSIVRVRAIGDGLEFDEYAVRGVGTGVVIVDRGVILTSLHVVAGASRLRVEFADGLEADATIVSTQPENDLAVIQAKNVPDDLRAATLSSTKGLAEGEAVTAVGFPFGIGPSVSAGVVSGLSRRYGELVDLIQFDAAANPGSSGGPLLNAAGEVVGIVTAILAAGESGAFSGIAFAVPIQRAARSAGLPPF